MTATLAVKEGSTFDRGRARGRNRRGADLRENARTTEGSRIQHMEGKMHAIKRNCHRKKNAEEEKNPVTTDVATAESLARQRVVRRLRIATMTARTAAEVTATSRLGNPDVTDGVPAVIGKVDERCKHGGSNSRGKIKKGRKNF